MICTLRTVLSYGVCVHALDLAVRKECFGPGVHGGPKQYNAQAATARALRLHLASIFDLVHGVAWVSRHAIRIDTI